MMLDIAIEADPEWDSSSRWETLVRSAAEAAVAESAFPQLVKSERPIELSIRLATDGEVKELNTRWRGKDKPTNVLSFPQCAPEELSRIAPAGPEVMLGDIVLARGVCEREAQAKGVSLEEHATHLLIHGTLHLLGYDHQDDGSAEDMERREVRALERLGISDPYEVRG